MSLVVQGINYPSKLASNRPETRPVWMRVTAAVAASGVSRSRLYEWIKEGRIRTACIRERHQKKGTRLIEAESLFRLIESMAEGGVQ
jgi:Helix-turn-helix domain